MKKQKFLLAFIMLLILTSCGSSFSRKSAMVDPGMKKSEVLDIMGAPGNRQFQGDSEAWQYCSTGMGSDKYWVIWFTRGAVVGMTTYNGYGTGACSQFYKQINWEDKPDQTIEIRRR